MVIITIIKGIIVGIMVSAPVGPIGILCMQKTINKGRISGYVAGLGASVADTLYAIVAGFGITIITNFLMEQQLYLRIGGGAILIFLGVKMFFADATKQYRANQRTTKKQNLAGDFITVFLLTISNPLTILAFGIFFAGLGFVQDDSSFLTVLEIIVGVFIGAMLWWGGVVTIVYALRDKFKLKRIYWINKLFGIGIVIFGLAAAISVFFDK